MDPIIHFEDAIIITDNVSEIEIIIKETGLEKFKSDTLLHVFHEFVIISNEWKHKAEALVVTDENDRTTMQMAGIGRKLLKSKRIELEKTRKSLKSVLLREGKAIDKVAEFLENLIVPTELYLLEQETFADRKQKEREDALIQTRKSMLDELGVDSSDLHLAFMTSAGFEQLYQAFNLEHDRKVAEELADQKALAETNRLAPVAVTERSITVAPEVVLNNLQASQGEPIPVQRYNAESTPFTPPIPIVPFTSNQSQDPSPSFPSLRGAADKVSLLAYADFLDKQVLPTCTSDIGKQISLNTTVLLNKISTYIRDKAQLL